MSGVASLIGNGGQDMAGLTTSPTAEREPALYQRVASALDDLQRDPHQGKPLKGELRGRYSYRVGSYRIVYLVRQRELLVLIIDVGHRRDIYR